MKRFHILGNCKTIEQMKRKNKDMTDILLQLINHQVNFLYGVLETRLIDEKRTIAELGACTFCIDNKV